MAIATCSKKMWWWLVAMVISHDVISDMSLGNVLALLSLFYGEGGEGALEGFNGKLRSVMMTPSSL